MGKLGLLLDVFPGFTSFSYPLVIKHGNGHFLMCRFYIFFGKPSFIDGFPIATFDYQRVFSNHTDGQSIPLRKSARSRLSRRSSCKMWALQALVQNWLGQNGVYHKFHRKKSRWTLWNFGVPYFQTNPNVHFYVQIEKFLWFCCNGCGRWSHHLFQLSSLA